MSMRIDLTSPVEAWKTTLPTPENPSCEVTLFNLSSLQVVSVEVTLLLSSADGEETAKIIHRGRGLNGAPGRTFQMTVPVEGHITPSGTKSPWRRCGSTTPPSGGTKRTTPLCMSPTTCTARRS